MPGACSGGIVLKNHRLWYLFCATLPARKKPYSLQSYSYNPRTLGLLCHEVVMHSTHIVNKLTREAGSGAIFLHAKRAVSGPKAAWTQSCMHIQGRVSVTAWGHYFQPAALTNGRFQ